MKIGRVIGVHDAMILSNFDFNIFRGFRCTGVKIYIFPLTLLVIVTRVLPQWRSLWCTVDVIYSSLLRSERSARGAKNHKLDITHSHNRREAPCGRILSKFRTSRDMADEIICAKFGVEN